MTSRYGRCLELLSNFGQVAVPVDAVPERLITDGSTAYVTLRSWSPPPDSSTVDVVGAVDVVAFALDPARYAPEHVAPPGSATSAVVDPGNRTAHRAPMG